MHMIRHCIDQCWEVLHKVSDPEIPVLSVVDLGMIRGVELNEQQEIIVRLTPTYSGCPDSGRPVNGSNHGYGNG